MLSTSSAERRAQLAADGQTAHGLALALIGQQEDVDSAPALDLRTLDGQLAILGGLLRERLRDVRSAPKAHGIAETSRVLHEVHTVRFSIHDHLAYERVRRLDDLDRGLAGLRGMPDQNKLSTMACRAAADHCGFDRVMVSKVDHETWRPWRSYARRYGKAERAFGIWMENEVAIRLGTCCSSS